MKKNLKEGASLAKEQHLKMVNAILKKYKGIFDEIEANQIANRFEGCSIRFALASIKNDLYNMSK